jgi:vacuolar-type H+-ATPase subunit D/Vma8
MKSQMEATQRAIKDYNEYVKRYSKLFSQVFDTAFFAKAPKSIDARDCISCFDLLVALDEARERHPRLYKELKETVQKMNLFITQYK